MRQNRAVLAADVHVITEHVPFVDTPVALADIAGFRTRPGRRTVGVSGTAGRQHHRQHIAVCSHHRIDAVAASAVSDHEFHHDSFGVRCRAAPRPVAGGGTVRTSPLCDDDFRNPSHLLIKRSAKPASNRAVVAGACDNRSVNPQGSARSAFSLIF